PAFSPTFNSITASVWSLPIGLAAAVTFGGSPAGASAISPSKPGSRAAVTTSFADRPRTASGSSYFADRVNGGFGVTATPTPRSHSRGGNNSPAICCCTAALVLANANTSLPPTTALACTFTSYAPGGTSAAARTGRCKNGGGVGCPAAGGGACTFAGTVTVPVNPGWPTTLSSI